MNNPGDVSFSSWKLTRADSEADRYDRGHGGPSTRLDLVRLDDQARSSAIGAAQPPQNLRPGGFSVPHFQQTTRRSDAT